MLSYTLHRLAHSSKYTERALAACNPSCPPDVLILLSRDVDVSVRHRVAKNLATPVDVLELMSEDPSPWARHLVVLNPSCPLDVVLRLTKDDDPMVRHAAYWAIEQRGIIGLIAEDDE